ncbi:hypothetical protein K1516_07385 [Stenotrophomonas maltophilia]|uniref:hypothetical protein n=1 Tax=Stenotrophomonas maltophilia TaxID=40324 RepID=UPI00200C037F|nr:hypothetical protein [Stenotrophomonas maltophilia]UQA71923.1 hypothetical protein K1516_07385 [Stenotrophomonas maltophilia]
MSNDNKTLADVRPGGRVRLGDALPPLPHPNYPVSKTGLQNNAYTASQMWDYARAALSAQPSRGGQDARSLAEHITDHLCHHEYDIGGRPELLACVADALAARQPVGEPVAFQLAGSEPLWCLHVLGMDDVHPAPSKAHAEKAAAWHNEQFKDQAARLGISIEAKVVPWPHSAESHADGVAEFIPQWLIPQWQLDALEANAKPTAQAVDLGQTFQAGVAEWMGQCFLPSLYSNMTERGDRLLEEVLELLQAHSYDKARVPTLVDYVFGRPVGDPAQEVGGVMVTLAGYCWVAGLDMHDAGDAELARINQPHVMAKIRAKQEAKNALHFDTPLPGNAAPPAQTVDLGPAMIPDTPEVRDILGRPNFWCSPWANVLRMRGDEIPNKAEEEQAAVIRFMLNHYLARGADWAETAGAELDAIRKSDNQAVGNG